MSEEDNEYTVDFILDPKLVEFLMAFGRSGLRVKVGRPTPSELPIITDLAAAPLDDDSIRLSYFANVPFYEYRIGGGSPVALVTNDIVGLNAATEYDFEIRGGHFAIGPWSAWSNIATVTTHAVPDPSIGSIANLTAVALGEISVQLAFTNATNAAAYQYRIDGGAPATLNAQRTVTGLTQNTEYDFEVRGANAGFTIFGAYSNLVTETTDATPPPGDFDPIDYLTAGEKAQLLDEYGITTIPFSRVWGLAGEPSCTYRQPTYDTGGSSIPGNALDISAYSGNVANWLAAMETQQKPGKAGSGTYDAAGLVTRGTQSIYGYGVSRPVFTGAWRHYVQANECRFQYIKRTGPADFWLIAQDNHTVWMTGSVYKINFFETASSEFKRLADHTGLYMLDCEFDNVNWPFLSFHENYRIKKFHIGRNIYRNCKTIGGINSKMFGDANLNGGNGIYFYGNDFQDAFHDPSASGHFGSWYGTLMCVFGQPAFSEIRATNGPDFYENNKIRNVIGCGLTKRDQNVAVVIHASESNMHYYRYNDIEDAYMTLYAVDSNCFYSYGTVHIEENYTRHVGSDQGYIGGTGDGINPNQLGVQDETGWNTSELPGAEGSFCTLKGGGGWNLGPTTVKKNIIIPTFMGAPVIQSGHHSEIEGNYIFNYKGKGIGNVRCAMIRTSHPGNLNITKANYFVGCGKHPYDHRRIQWLQATLGGGAAPSNSTDDIQNLTVNFDSNRRDCVYNTDQITSSVNGLGQSLMDQTVFEPQCQTPPKMIRSGGNFVINSNGAWNLGPVNYDNSAPVPLTYEWYRNAVKISGQTASSMSESQWTGTIQGVVVGTIGGKETRAATLPEHKLVSELIPGGPASFSDSSSTASVTQDYAIGSLTTDAWYRLRFTQNVNSGILSVKITGGTRPGQIHRNSRLGTFVYEFRAQAGENNIRFITASSSIVTISGISCGKITGSPVMGQAW